MKLSSPFGAITHHKKTPTPYAISAARIVGSLAFPATILFGVYKVMDPFLDYTGWMKTALVVGAFFGARGGFRKPFCAYPLSRKNSEGTRSPKVLPSTYGGLFLGLLFVYGAFYAADVGKTIKRKYDIQKRFANALTIGTLDWYKQHKKSHTVTPNVVTGIGEEYTIELAGEASDKKVKFKIALKGVPSILKKEKWNEASGTFSVKRPTNQQDPVQKYKNAIQNLKNGPK